MWWLALAACWVTEADIAAHLDDTDVDPDTDSDTDTDTDADTTPFGVKAVSPAHGSNAGGDVVELTLDEAVDVTAVRFGLDVASILDVSGKKVTVSTPPTSTDGPVDVVVEAGAREGVALSGYRYWPDATGKTTALGEVAWWSYQGTYWGDDPDDGAGWFGFTEPTDVDWIDLYGGLALDTCAKSGPAVDVTWRDPGIPTLDLDGAPYTFDRGVYDASTLGRGGMMDGGDLSMDGDPAWPALEVADFIAPLAQVDITSPAVDGNTPDFVFSSSFQIQWSGTAGDAMVIRLYRYEGENVVDEVECRVKDDGQFKVPASVWTRWTTGDQVTIVVGRTVFPDATLPFDHGRVRVATTWWAVGAVFTL